MPDSASTYETPVLLASRADSGKRNGLDWLLVFARALVVLLFIGAMAYMVISRNEERARIISAKALPSIPAFSIDRDENLITHLRDYELAVRIAQQFNLPILMGERDSAKLHRITPAQAFALRNEYGRVFVQIPVHRGEVFDLDNNFHAAFKGGITIYQANPKQ